MVWMPWSLWMLLCVPVKAASELPGAFLEMQNLKSPPPTLCPNLLNHNLHFVRFMRHYRLRSVVLEGIASSNVSRVGVVKGKHVASASI